MAERIISTYGNAEKFTTSALMGYGATQQDANGRFYLDGTMVNVDLSRVVADAIYIRDIYRDGQSVNGKYTTGQSRNGAVRVMLNTPLPFSSRTVSFGGRAGTEGNSGVINTNGAQLPANDEFIVYLNQINDQMMLFPDLSAEYIPLDVMANRINSYADRVSMDRSASITAEILAYNIYRALNGAQNLVNAGDLSAEGAYGDLVNTINSAMDNGDPERGAFTYPTSGRTIIGRPSFINGIFNSKSGLLMLGSDLAQTMLNNYNLDTPMGEREYVGTGYRGHAAGLHFQSAPDYIWTLAEAYLGLAKGSLDNVKAIAVSYDATAVATNIDRGVKIVPATEVRGSLAQPLNIWGHEAFRLSYIIGDSTLDTSYLEGLGFSADVRKHPVAPKVAEANTLGSNTISVPVYGIDGKVVGFREVASVPKPNGDNIQSGAKTVLPVTSSVPAGEVESGTSVTLSTLTTGADIFYTVDGSQPTIASTKFTTAITLSADTTIKAIAYKDGWFLSQTSTFAYTIATEGGGGSGVS